MLKSLTLVLGGASSGKSSFAENLVVQTGYEKIYLATAQAWDDEMRTKVLQHREQRGSQWITHEEPLNPATVLGSATSTQVVLLDCATMWLSNHLLADSDLAEVENQLFDAIDKCQAPIVVVSNEVGLCVVPDNALARRFQNAQGRLNQKLAAQADLVVTVMAGLPLALKGQLP
ncbi:MAG: bifunctional adenosylcobinamide kinase/adenosylcobinamide-phosphate guanylyltransferase [Thalassovita sp.]